LYLSRVSLNVKRRETQQALVLLQQMHAAVEQSFTEHGHRNLWRVDWFDNVCYLLVLSEHQPDFSHIVERFGYVEADGDWETKNYSLLLVRLKEGQTWQFRLRANPTRSSFKEKSTETGRGKVFAHVTQTQQKQWLIDKAAPLGFSVSEETFDIVHTQWDIFSKTAGGKREVSIRTATFEGALTVTDNELFKGTLLKGIGRAKAYGCGLLTIANCRIKVHG
jgi:CRISPR system Cascade subunit CasE